MATMMQCGHSAQGTKDGKPVCVGCYGIVPGADVPAPEPDLSGRTATCRYGEHGAQPSSVGLAFFEHRPGEDHDSYYCGCYGWN